LISVDISKDSRVVVLEVDSALYLTWREDRKDGDRCK
jgi:hypothetical protein